MFNDMDLNKMGNEASCTLTSTKIQEYALGFMEGRWALLVPGEEDKWFRGYDYPPGGRWDFVACEIVENV